MNQKDYKAIAEIFQDIIPKTTGEAMILSLVITNLADYFEKEDKNNERERVVEFNPDGIKWDKFDRKQFLKDAGVIDE